MGMKNIVLALVLVFLSATGFAIEPPVESNKSKNTTPKARQCEMHYLTKHDLSALRTQGTPIATVSRAINGLLKTSFDFANMIDHYTLGLASAITLGSVLGTANSFEDIKPNQWNKAQFVGSLVYKDQPFAATPIRGASIKFTSEKSSQSLKTGTKGEFSGQFYKLISYSRFRLFPMPIFERKQKLVKTIKVPLTIEVDSPVCKAKLRLTRIPLEPITLILTRKI